MKELDYGSMGMRIRQVRKARGWSQDELAQKCGISMSFLGHIERGTRVMSLETFVGICQALGTDADGLLWGAVHPSDSLLDMWNQPGHACSGQERDLGMEDGAGSGMARNTGSDSYSMYIRIMKSVAEIMSEA